MTAAEAEVDDIGALAVLSFLDYAKERKQAAKKLGVTAALLDRAVNERREVKKKPKLVRDIGASSRVADVTELWRARLLFKPGPQGLPYGNVANIVTVLRAANEWKGILRYDEFRQRVRLVGRSPWGAKDENRDWQDVDDTRAMDWFQRQGINIESSRTMAAGVDSVARENGFHPVRDYLTGLRWDGQPRLDLWVPAILGAEDTPYHRAIGARWMISAVARIMEAGCKADCAIILEGEQGILKSTALGVLGGAWFTDEIAEFGNKDASMQVSGAWIIEIAELDAMSKAEVHKVKAFMSRRIDRFRMPYAARVDEFPRQCVFAGTVNMNDYLRDETGGRRFWPIACGEIDIEQLREMRDQLWAEAAHRFNDGENWWIDTPELLAASKEEQAGRYSADAWQILIDDWLIGHGETTVTELLRDCLQLAKDRWGQTEQNRVSRCLKALGWERRQRREGRNRSWVYFSPTPGFL